MDIFKLWLYGNPDLFHQNEGAEQPRIWHGIKDPNHLAIVEAMAMQFIRKMYRELLYLKRVIGGILNPIET